MSISASSSPSKLSSVQKLSSPSIASYKTYHLHPHHYLQQNNMFIVIAINCIIIQFLQQKKKHLFMPLRKQRNKLSYNILLKIVHPLLDS